VESISQHKEKKNELLNYTDAQYVATHMSAPNRPQIAPSAVHT